MKAVSSWGRLASEAHHVVTLTDPVRAAAQISASTGAGLPYGAGRSYGDVCLNPGGTLWDTSGLDHFIRFDEATGQIGCEAGVLLRDIQRLAVPRGWMLPVVPGTQIVTVGGAIANDVHGKNHHSAGSFGDTVLALKLVRTDGQVVECGPATQADWFSATVGGMGLTGLIVHATLQLRRVPGPWLETETIPYGGIDEFFDIADESESAWEHTVSWIDCVSRAGRGLFMRARPKAGVQRKAPAARERTMPFEPPLSLVNRLSLRAFNGVYYHLKKARRAPRTEHYERFLYPLDNLHHWNRMYGPRGFYQYQCVLPHAVRRDALDDMLAAIRASGEGSFLAVLKTFGAREGWGMLSFPRHGATLALDFPNHGASTLALFERLDAIVAEAGGRLYAAKDARMPRGLFEAGYPRIADFLRYRDPGISSAMSRRLLGS